LLKRPFTSSSSSSNNSNNSFRGNRDREAPIDKDGARTNEQIRAPEVRVIDQDGEMLGVMHPREAVQMAREIGLDLIEISPNAAPPVCKIGDYGKYRYEVQKKKNEAKKNQKKVEIKELKLRPNIDPHDYEIKMKAAKKFLEEGDKVKFTLRFRGREMANMAINTRIFEKVRADIVDFAKIESSSGLEGRQMMMMIAPLSKQEREKALQTKAEKAAEKPATAAPTEPAKV
jgi:translation initiation factor IF-3